jgi:hypothetical protein
VKKKIQSAAVQTQSQYSRSTFGWKTLCTQESTKKDAKELCYEMQKNKKVLKFNFVFLLARLTFFLCSTIPTCYF